MKIMEVIQNLSWRVPEVQDFNIPNKAISTMGSTALSIGHGARVSSTPRISDRPKYKGDMAMKPPHFMEPRLGVSFMKPPHFIGRPCILKISVDIR